MSIQQQQIGKLHHIRVSGRLDQGQTPQLDQALNSLLEAGHHHLIINLAQTNYINSGGLRCLVSAWRKSRDHNGRFVLCGLNERLREIFEMVGFDNVFPIYPNFETAQQAFTNNA